MPVHGWCRVAALLSNFTYFLQSRASYFFRFKIISLNLSRSSDIRVRAAHTHTQQIKVGKSKKKERMENIKREKKTFFSAFLLSHLFCRFWNRSRRRNRNAYAVIHGNHLSTRSQYAPRKPNKFSCVYAKQALRFSSCNKIYDHIPFHAHNSTAREHTHTRRVSCTRIYHQIKFECDSRGTELKCLVWPLCLFGRIENLFRTSVRFFRNFFHKLNESEARWANEDRMETSNQQPAAAKRLHKKRPTAKPFVIFFTAFACVTCSIRQLWVLEIQFGRMEFYIR